MKNTIIISLAFILILIGSCRKKLDIDIPDGDKHIVVNGIITQDSLIKVNISKSQNALDSGKIPVLTNATVKLFEDNTFIEDLMHIEDGNYISSITPELEKKYKITVDYGNLKSVAAKMELITAVPIASIDTTIETEIIDEGMEWEFEVKNLKLEITINDNPDENDFYFLSLSTMMPNYDYSEEPPLYIGLIETELYFDSEDLVFRNNNSNFHLNNMYGHVFTDELFNGSQYTVDIETSLNYRDVNDPELLEITAQQIVKIKLLTVNEDIYRYITSYNLNQESEYDPFAQPVQIFTNVENGLGLFSGYTMHVDSLVLENN